MTVASLPPAQALAPEPDVPPRYEAPAIVWEQEFAALAQVSQPNCNPCGPPPCQIEC